MTEVGERLCNKYNLKKKLVGYIEQDIWQMVHHYLTKPEEVEKGIVVPYNFRFKIKRESIKKRIEDGRRKPSELTEKFLKNGNEKCSN